MIHTVTAAFIEGTQRTKTPEKTLEYIRPKLPLCGITRVADVTRLDRPGIPTCCAIRPTADYLQVTNGKGASKKSAQVSALMEAVELFHAESSTSYDLLRTSEEDLESNSIVGDHRNLHSYEQATHDTKRIKRNWIDAECVASNSRVWLPACSVFFDQQPAIHNPTTNGLASGNHVVEASLHALYELIERDAGARLSLHGRMNLARDTMIIEPKTIQIPALADMIDRMSHDSRLVIVRANSVIDVHTFWVVLLNDRALSSMTALNIGWGTHPNAEIALSRALTEAAQSRLTFIHGGREDIVVQAVYQEKQVQHSPAYTYFSKLDANTSWTDIPPDSITDTLLNNLQQNWELITGKLADAGYDKIYRCVLTRPNIDIPVVKLLIPKLQFNRKLF